MVDMFTIYRTCVAMMEKYDGIVIMCNYCSVCGAMQIDISCPALDIFTHHIYTPKETTDALTKLHELYYDFILQPAVMKYLREGLNHDHNHRSD